MNRIALVLIVVIGGVLAWQASEIRQLEEQLQAQQEQIDRLEQPVMQWQTSDTLQFEELFQTQQEGIDRLQQPIIQLEHLEPAASAPQEDRPPRGSRNEINGIPFYIFPLKASKDSLLSR